MGLLLRHPVVITSLEEDFRKLGLITESRDEESDPQATDLMESDEGDDGDEAIESDEDFAAMMAALGEDDEDGDETIESDEDDEDPAMAEAVEFYESWTSKWDEMGENGAADLTLDESDMSDLESMASEVTDLPLSALQGPGGYLDEAGEEDDEDGDYEVDDDDDSLGEDDESYNPFAAVAEAMSAIESVLDEDATPPQTLDEATPAFANLALIAEKLYGFFTEVAEAQEDSDYSEIAESYAQIARYSAGVVSVLNEEDHETIDFEALGETFQEYLKSVLEGLETYAILREVDAGEDTDEGDDEDIDEGND